MTCLRCGGVLSGTQTKYCSTSCSKLYLKSQYRKRNKEKINAYKRNYYRSVSRPSGLSFDRKRQIHLKGNPVCEKCGTREDIQVHHIKPLKQGGTHKPSNLMTLCRKHHTEFEKITADFFKKTL